ncbi:MAG: TolC family protein, partial [Planctomycetota bacterium]
HITGAKNGASGETGAMILKANIPLLRGAGRVAYESRYQAERDLIYAVRTFERFRRSLAVDIASDYFNLQQQRQVIINADLSIQSYNYAAERAKARWEAGWEIALDVGRAEQERLQAISGKIDDIETYQTNLDQFKINIGMPIDTPSDVPYPEYPTTKSGKTGKMEAESLEESIRMPEVMEKEAIRVALKYRLDLLNNFDFIDDSRRGVWIAQNNLLPDLEAFGSVQMDTNPSELGFTKYNTERTTWRAGLTLELPLDRKEERNTLRSAVISKRQAERNYELAKDRVRLEVRRAIRRVQQARTSLDIQIMNRDLALKRRQAAKIRLDKGQINNRDLIEAEEDLLDARNSLAQAQADLRLAILQFRRDTGTLRIDDEGKWLPTKKKTSRGG